MCSEPTNVARAPAERLRRPTPTAPRCPRIEYSSSEPCALTTNGAPVAAPTGPPSSTWFANTRSAGRSSRTAAAFASTHARARRGCSPGRAGPRTPRSGRGRRPGAARRRRGARSPRRRGRTSSGSRLLAQDGHVVPGAAPLARELARVDVRPGAAEQVAVPEQDPGVILTRTCLDTVAFWKRLEFASRSPVDT